MFVELGKKGMRSGVIQVIAVIVSGFMMVGSAWYWGQMLRKEMASTYLKVAVRSVRSQIKKTPSIAQKKRIASTYAGFFYQKHSEIRERPGYWKTLHKTYHLLAQAAIYQGRPAADVIALLEKSVNYHPYYANAYKMMSQVWGIFGKNRQVKACDDVYRGIMAAKPAADIDSMIGLCIGEKLPIE
jgi:hypothetical protein